jgi:hypothetical protein
MGEVFGLLAAGVLMLGQPTMYELADGRKALTELEAKTTVGKLVLLPEKIPSTEPVTRTPEGCCRVAARWW